MPFRSLEPSTAARSFSMPSCCCTTASPRGLLTYSVAFSPPSSCGRPSGSTFSCAPPSPPSLGCPSTISMIPRGASPVSVVLHRGAAPHATALPGRHGHRARQGGAACVRAGSILWVAWGAALGGRGCGLYSSVACVRDGVRFRRPSVGFDAGAASGLWRRAGIIWGGLCMRMGLWGLVVGWGCCEAGAVSVRVALSGGAGADEAECERSRGPGWAEGMGIV
mmetsp:Transcript_37660/g.118749  ORF Transcript_37660/g.118749 Transcript_37660/m.118749 type:complete len:222 (-) Transcript_37660:998-1663(-)